MQTKNLLQLITASAIYFAGNAAIAHTTVMHTEEMALNRAADVDMSIVFTHATDGGPTMPISVESFTQYSGRTVFLEEIDLMDNLSSVQWLDHIDEDGNEVRVDAYQAHIPRDQIRSLGDHQLVLVTEPYYDPNDKIYIQQFTKVIMNVGGGQTNWFSTLGLPTEIQPLKTPYANWVGETFSGIVYSDGEPVPFARLEIDYLNYGVDAENAKFSDMPFIEASHPSYKYISILTNENGEFHFGIPAPGWWAIAALGTGPEVRIDNVYLSQDAILWIYAEEVPLTPAGRAQ
jgi:cobalt/nickel transport protein